MNNKCPICNAAGLNDFTKSHIICHQCNSDLKAFLILNSISVNEKRNYRNYSVIGMSILTVLFLGLFVKSNIDKTKTNTNNIILNDSILKLKNKIYNIEKNHKKNKNREITIEYIVKNGDYPYKIAQFFYGDGNKYKQIENDNDLIQPYCLKVGQVLLIKIYQ